jgi:hypothetical protein
MIIYCLALHCFSTPHPVYLPDDISAPTETMMLVLRFRRELDIPSVATRLCESESAGQLPQFIYSLSRASNCRYDAAAQSDPKLA